MARFVMKFGGTSVANIALLERIADRVQRVQKAGHEAVLVVSAMGHETDRLVTLAESVDFQSLATRRELDRVKLLNRQDTTRAPSRRLSIQNPTLTMLRLTQRTRRTRSATSRSAPSNLVLTRRHASTRNKCTTPMVACGSGLNGRRAMRPSHSAETVSSPRSARGTQGWKSRNGISAVCTQRL